jgi:hypothetical protein
MQHTFAQGNLALSGSFQKLSEWCKEVFSCQQKVNTQLAEVHHFSAEVVLNLRTQATYINDLGEK